MTETTNARVFSINDVVSAVTNHRLLLGASCAILFPVNAMADSTSSSPAANPASSLVGIFLLVSFLTRKRPVGGWLMLFVLQSYFGLAIALISLIRDLEALTPGFWADQGTYLLYLLYVLPDYVYAILFALALTQILPRSNWKPQYIVRLRWLMIAGIAINLLSLVQGFAFWDSTDTPLTTMAIVGKAIWIPFFFFSKRIARVYFNVDSTGYQPISEGVPLPTSTINRESSCLGCGRAHSMTEEEWEAGWYTCNNCYRKQFVHSVTKEFVTDCSKCGVRVILDKEDNAAGSFACPKCGCHNLIDFSKTQVRPKEEA